MTGASFRGPDGPLRDWGRALRDARARRRRRLRAGLAALAAAGVALVSARPGSSILLWNATASAPRGLYLVTAPRHLSRGDWIAVAVPSRVAALAVARHYVGAGVPLVKRIAAVSGDTVCARHETIVVNGRPVAIRSERDAGRRPLPAWSGCRTIGASEVFLLNPAPASFDGRYFGPSRRGDIIGIVHLLPPAR